MGMISALLLAQIPPNSRHLLTDWNHSRSFPFLLNTHQTRSPKTPRGFVFVVFAEGHGPSKDNPAERETFSGDGREDLKRDRRPVFNLRWRDLLEPDPDNILAIGLTGLLAWASVQVLWQLFFISLAIVVAALKYSFIAAFLLFILITLL